MTDESSQVLSDAQIMTMASELPGPLRREFIAQRKRIWREYEPLAKYISIRTQPAYLVALATKYAELYQRSLAQVGRTDS